jgi:hypothetical protein
MKIRLLINNGVLKKRELLQRTAISQIVIKIVSLQKRNMIHNEEIHSPYCNSNNLQKNGKCHRYVY